MIEVAVRDFSRDAWNSTVAGFQDGSLMQSWEYAEAKARTGPWRVERGVLADGGRTAGAFQALVRDLPAGLPGGLVWINRGPLWRPVGVDETDTARLIPLLIPLLAALRRHYADQGGRYLRLAPMINDRALTPKDITEAGLAQTAAPGWASAILDLTPSVDDLRARLKGKWRGHLNKGERNGLTIRAGDEADLFAAFVAHHGQLIAARGFDTSLTPDLLEGLQDLLPAARKMKAFLAYDDDGDVLGSVLMARYGDTCEYLAGNTGDQGRRRNAGQVLIWRALTAMKDEGCTRLDLSGMDPDTTPPGIYTFKEGLGAVPYRLATELEAVGGFLGPLVRWRVNRARGL